MQDNVGVLHENVPLSKQNGNLFVIYILNHKMDPFFMYVSIGALVLLIIILIVVGVTMSQLRSQDPFPPIMNACPDYWDVSSNPAYCGVPVDTNMNNIGYIATTQGVGVNKESKENIGMCTGNPSNFGCKNDGTYLNLDPAPSTAKPNFQYVQLSDNKSWSTLYPGKSERCAQRSWAQTMNISWDGVSNYNGC